MCFTQRWVQVKPAGTSRAPVDLHYDKDELLAEKFALGSFPTLSTVTYLTGENDNQPTVVFPHTYNDEEDRTIESMLLSHPVRAKHLVFDGRLLHGAPAHPALLRKKCENTTTDKKEQSGDDSDNSCSLRVTFLVNIWQSGRPAGVTILSETIRSKIKEAAGGAQETIQVEKPLEFQQRHVSRLKVGKSLTKSFENNDVINLNNSEMIILPFVSQGATWIGDDEDGNDDEGGNEDHEEGGEERNEEDIADVDTNEGALEEDGSEEDEEEDNDDELVLALPPFATAEYMADEADTIILSFEGSKKARLVRGELDEDNAMGCSWKKLIETKRSNEFLSYLHEHVPYFVASIAAGLKSQCDMDVSDLQADHICYRTDTIEQYTILVEALQSSGDFALLVESEIGGRPIATFKLATPIEVESADSNHSIDVIEIPSPKEGSPYNAGLEHAEFVIGDDTCSDPSDSDVHQSAFKSWMEKYPSVSWNIKAMNKQCNPDISTKLEIEKYGKVSIKFHRMPLEDVIKFEVVGL